jgi:gamma-F420-2:alpha-L-glutamate ligase
MTAWIIYNREGAAYNKQYIKFYIEEGARLDINIKLILIEELEFGVRDSKWFISYRQQEIEKPDFAICRVIYPLLSRQLSYMDIPVFNNAFVAEISNDKARTYQYLAKTGITMVDSSFYQNNQLKELLHHIEKPTVIKAVDGHGGSQVFLTAGQDQKDRTMQCMDLGSATSSEDILVGIKSSDVVLQPLTGNRHQDLRVYVIGKRIVAAVLRTAKEGFKSNFSLGGEVRLYTLSKEEQSIVERIIQEFDFGLVGIDFIIGDEGELIFNEIEDVVGSRMLYQCSDINIVRLYLEFILDKL